MSTPEDPKKPNSSGQSPADRAKDAVTDRVRQPPPLQPRPLPRPIPSVPAAAKPPVAAPPTSPAQGPNVGEPTAAMPKVTPAESAAPHHQVDETRPSQVRAPQSGQPHPPQHQGPRTQGARPVQQPAAAKAPEPSLAKPADAAATKVQNGHAHGAGAPPWQRGNQPPQREPQSNLNRPGEPPVAGRPPAPGNRDAAVAGAAEAAKAQRKEAVQAKSAAIDGPTRNIPRPELAKDMPDLSAVRHPLPAEPSTSSPQAAAVATAVPAAEGAPLRATVQIRKIDPWSTLKVSLVISVALFFVWMVAVGLLYVVLDGMGVWDRLNNAFTEIVTESGSDGLVTSGQIFGYAAGIGLINVVLFTALATIGSFIYNQCSDLVGGIEVTLADPD